MDAMSGWTATERGEGDNAREAIRVTFTLSEEDLRRGIKELPALRRVFWMWGILIGLFLVIWVALSPTGPDSMSVLSAVVPCVLLGLAFWYFTGMGAKRQHRSMRDAERDITYEFTPSGFSSESPGASSHVDYSRVHRYVDAKHSLLIFCNSSTAQVVPKRAFAAGDLETVQHWLQAAVQPRRTKTFLARSLILWIVLIVAFLAIWQFLQPGSPLPPSP